MTTTWYALAALATLAGVAVLVKPSLLHWPWLSPTTPDEPGDDDREASGADEEYPDELRAAKKMTPSPDLIRPAEQMVADHEALAGISAALDHFDRTISDELSRFLRKQPQTILRLPSAVETTGEFDVRELDAMLAGAS